MASPTTVPTIETLSAVTLAVRDMARSVAFYENLGFEKRHGGENADFTSFRVGGGYLNLIVELEAAPTHRWGRVIFYVSDVDGLYRIATGHGYRPEAPPRDAEWHERYFHLADPDGHELSFARPLR